MLKIHSVAIVSVIKSLYNFKASPMCKQAVASSAQNWFANTRV
jgi:hypothetical protein